MPHTRLLLAAVPPILSDIIRDALAEVHGVEVVRETAGEDLAESVARSRADVLVTEDAGQELSDRHLGLMYRHPRLKLLTISPDGRRAALYRLMPRRRLLVDVSPDGLVAAIRGAVRPGGAEG